MGDKKLENRLAGRVGGCDQNSGRATGNERRGLEGRYGVAVEFGVRVQDWACLVISSAPQMGVESRSGSDLHTGEFALCPCARQSDLTKYNVCTVSLRTVSL